MSCFLRLTRDGLRQESTWWDELYWRKVIKAIFRLLESRHSLAAADGEKINFEYWYLRVNERVMMEWHAMRKFRKLRFRVFDFLHEASRRLGLS